MTTQTLTVSYETTQTIAFASNDSSVTGLSSVAVTVSDGTNYYYYSPSEDKLGTQVDAVASSTYTWQTVYGLGDGTTSSSPTSSSNGYLQSSGSQYIDTGAYFNSEEDSFSIVYQNTNNNPSGYSLLGGGLYSTSDGEMYIGYPNNNNQFRFLMIKSSSTIDDITLYSNRDTTTKYTIVYDDSKIYLDGTQIGTTTAQIDTAYTTTLFANGRGGSLVSVGYFKIYSYSYSDNGVVSRNFIPIQIGTSGEYALYDISFKDNGNTKVIYTNDGSGSFSGGGTQSALTYPHTPSAPTVAIDSLPSQSAINTAISLRAEGTPVTSGNTLTFQWAYSTDGTTYTNFGSATTSNPNTTTYTPTTSGTYYFRVTVTESGVSTTAQAVSSAVTVVPATVSISTQPSSPVAVGSTITATASAHGATLTYQWAVSVDGGTYANISGQTSTTLNYITQTKGTYVFRCTVTETTSAYTVSATTNSVSVVTRVGDNDTYYLVGSDGTTIAFDDASYSVLRDSLEGLSGYPVDYEVSQTPGVLGTEVINTVINEREISLQVLIYGEGRAELEDRRRALIRALNPLVGPCKLYWHQENGNTYYITCRPDDGCPSFDEGTAHSARTWQCTLDLICHDPCWHSKEDKEYSLINDEVGFCLPFQIPFTLGNMSPDIYVENGTATSPIQVVLTGPMTAPIRIQNVTTDEEIYIRHDIDEDDTITINTDRSDIYVKYYDASEGTTTSVLSYCSVGSKFWQLQPGMNHVHFEVYDIQEGANGVLKFSEKSVGI